MVNPKIYTNANELRDELINYYRLITDSEEIKFTVDNSPCSLRFMADAVLVRNGNTHQSIDFNLNDTLLNNIIKINTALHTN